MDGVHGVEPGRADLDEAALTLEDGALAARLAGDDDACVTVVKSQAVVVLRHEQRVGVRLFSSAWKAGLCSLRPVSWLRHAPHAACSACVTFLGFARRLHREGCRASL